MNKEKAKTVLEKYLKAWMQKDYLKMYKHCQITWQGDHSQKNLEKLYKDINLSEYSIMEMVEQGTAALRVGVLATINGEKCTFDAMVICEVGAYAPSVNGVWGVNPISTLKVNV